ncbi:hypothetical protein BaRGS_00038371 [Batillaria attramentaria]|uniref:Uncharacterized protein n=1 Tax=Batillaria attramentaria TaxID=370345 RepID=A0ABD0J5W4_9CAEN
MLISQSSSSATVFGIRSFSSLRTRQQVVPRVVFPVLKTFAPVSANGCGIIRATKIHVDFDLCYLYDAVLKSSPGLACSHFAACKQHSRLIGLLRFNDDVIMKQPRTIDSELLDNHAVSSGMAKASLQLRSCCTGLLLGKKGDHLWHFVLQPHSHKSCSA